MLAVEAGVRAYALERGAPEEVWGLAGLLHDLDWEKYPDEHPLRAVEALRERGYPDEVLQAILAHRAHFTGVQPTSELDKVLVACDELSGLVMACALVRPTGIEGMEPRSVIKKMKDRGFAAGVSREEVAHGMELLGVDRTEHIARIIEAQSGIAAELGIRAEDLQR